MARSSPFTVIDSTAPWLARVSSSSSSGISVRLTDLCAHYLGSVDSGTLQQQLEEFDDPAQVLHKLHDCLEGKEPTALYAFRVEVLDAFSGTRRFLWDLGGSTAITVVCWPSQDSAACIRDELLLPLLRAGEAAWRMASAEVTWPSLPAGVEQFLPDMGAPALRALLVTAGGPQGDNIGEAKASVASMPAAGASGTSGAGTQLPCSDSSGPALTPAPESTAGLSEAEGADDR